ncbi:helix-turn-helix transcriptional regulator [Photobacterium phosphoreum]|uniref:helix-turn-helix transcriptional regulator n=1 Tax=Photobacterium phosphoreum TaxID=659 RepID=UPI0039AF77C1
MSKQNAAYFPDRLISEKECAQMTGLCRTTRWEMEKQNNFPSKRRVGERKVMWLLSEVLCWMNSLEKFSNEETINE